MYAFKRVLNPSPETSQSLLLMARCAAACKVWFAIPLAAARKPTRMRPIGLAAPSKLYLKSIMQCGKFLDYDKTWKEDSSVCSWKDLISNPELQWDSLPDILSNM